MSTSEITESGPPSQSADARGAATKKSWRDVLKVHPAAEQFDLLPKGELLELGLDIIANGMTSPIAVWVDWPTTKGAKPTYQLLDGRNRLDSIEAAGGEIEIVLGKKDIEIWANDVEGDIPRPVLVDGLTDPYDFVISANVHRRHLSAEQRRDRIINRLKADPTKSDRKIAKQTGSNRTTVGQVRKELESTGDVSIVDTRTDTKGRQQPAKKKCFGSVLPDGLPKPKAARQKAREKDAMVLASDGYYYTGATDEQVKEAEDQLSLVYGLDRAVAHIASIDMTPAQFLKYAQHHQPNQIETAEDLARLERATEWLTELVAIGRKRLRGAGTSTAETTAQSSTQAIADQHVDNVLKHADFGGAEPTDPAVDDPRQLDLIALITPQVEAKVEPTAQGPTDTGGGSDPGELPGFLKRAQSVPAEAAQ
jgi:hypothetical protein